MNRPKILISCGSNAANYVNAIEKLGAEAFGGYCPLPDLTCDGLILCGGADIHPKYFGEDINGSEGIDTVRDEAEFILADAFANRGKPILGICRGHQLLNVYFGGSLIQHLDTAAHHSSFGEVDLVHLVNAEKNSVLERLYGSAFFVNSHHHQGISKLGDGFKAVAYAEDGVVEACEHISLPVFSVQFHPERMCFDKARRDTADGEDILSYFVSVCISGIDKAQ